MATNYNNKKTVLLIEFTISKDNRIEFYVTEQNIGLISDGYESAKDAKKYIDERLKAISSAKNEITKEDLND